MLLHFMTATILLLTVLASFSMRRVEKSMTVRYGLDREEVDR